jgi:hypothetical protein
MRETTAQRSNFNTVWFNFQTYIYTMNKLVSLHKASIYITDIMTSSAVVIFHAQLISLEIKNTAIQSTE